MASSKRSREIANAIVKSQERLVRRGVASGARFGLRAQRAALRAFGKRDPAQAFRDELIKAVPTLAEAMLAAHLSAQVLMLGNLQLAREPRTVFGKTTKALQKRLALQEAVIARIADTYKIEAVAVLTKTELLASANITAEMVKIQLEGLHVGAAKRRLRDTFKKLGLGTGPHVMERVFRTQINMGYSAGRWAVNQDPDIDAILWGYEYVAVLDSRARPEHEGLDGTILPKGDPFWQANFPPNGYNCRCQAIEVFDAPKDAKKPPDEFTTTQNGKKVTVKPGADPGFRFNPGEVFNV